MPDPISTEQLESDREIERIKKMYEERDGKMPYRDWESNLYHPRHPLGHQVHAENRRLLRDGLDALEADLFDLDALDIGCGYGYWLRQLVELGGNPARMCGVDLSAERIAEARTRNPAIRWVHGNAADLSLAQESIDLVIQSVVFSSIQDAESRRSLATEIDRVARPGALLLWHDLRPKLGRRPHVLVQFSTADVLDSFPGWALLSSERCDPRYVTQTRLLRRALNRVVYDTTRLASDSWFLVLQKQRC